MKIVVFAGGVGTRLWPLSRKNTPKQFGKIIGDKSTLQQTVDRILPEFGSSDIYIATGSRYEKIVREQLPQIPSDNFIFEPEMRDVGPAIGLAAAILEKIDKDEPIAMLWSDHLVKNQEQFREALRQAEQLIVKEKGKFVFIAQKPRFANLNIGWIELGSSIPDGSNVYHFKKLIYRPQLQQAEEFIKLGNFVWNLGYFVTTPRLLMSLFKTFVPNMFEKLLLIQNAWNTKNYQQTLNEVYPVLEKISFDDAILQKIQPDNIFVILEDLGWSDVGAWEALKEALAKTEDENVTHGKIMTQDSRDSLLFNYTNQLCVGIDLDGILVINTEDVILICPKSSVPKIKKLVESLTGSPYEHLA